MKALWDELNAKSNQRSGRAVKRRSRYSREKTRSRKTRLLEEIT